VLNLLLQLRDYLILLVTLMVTTQRLFGTLTSVGADVVKKCTCSCAPGSPTIQQCFLNKVSNSVKISTTLLLRPM
jgi:hypothetical protein